MEWLLWFFAVAGAVLGAFNLYLIWGLLEVVEIIIDDKQPGKGGK